jgi:membrane-bound lytic murein transglycosylase D
MKGWGRPYFDIMNNILSQHGLPTELKYLSVIESALKTYAVSWAGAVGPWQFMPATARNLGLRVTKKVDDRVDFYKSTHAAARYLTELYGIYNDWLLVIAAYNGGPGNVNSAIRKSGSKNFWDLQYYLPTESRNHVKKFIATHYIMEGDGGITTVTKKEAENLLLNPVEETTAITDASTLNVTGKYHSIVISQFLKMNIAEFSRLNPNFDKVLGANGNFDLRLPADKMLLFQANKPQILEQSIKLLLTMDGRL